MKGYLKVGWPLRVRGKIAAELSALHPVRALLGEEGSDRRSAFVLLGKGFAGKSRTKS